MDELKRATSRLHNENDTMDKLTEENSIQSNAIDKAQTIIKKLNQELSRINEENKVFSRCKSELEVENSSLRQRAQMVDKLE